MKKISVIGAGTMGSGIAQVAATSGFEVKLYDTNTEALEKSKHALERILNRLIEKKHIDSNEKQRIQNNITYSVHLVDLSDSDLVIEAIIENLDIKKEVFRSLEGLVSKKTILASNTSSLSIASIASVLDYPERCIGLHFFNPAPLMKLVEVVPALQTAKTILEQSKTLMQNWGKVVAVAKDTPGFIVNRVARPFYGESLRIYEEGIANIETIDYSLKTLGNFKMGPFQLMDFIGNDINYTVTETVFKAFYFDPRYKPSFTQKRYAEAGFLGRKSGKGYYNYTAEGKIIESENNIDESQAEAIFNRVLAMLINEAADALFWNIASAKDIDNAMLNGVNYPKGLLAWADQKGIDWCVNQMDVLHDIYKEERYRCSPLLRKMKHNNQSFFKK